MKLQYLLAVPLVAAAYVISGPSADASNGGELEKRVESSASISAQSCLSGTPFVVDNIDDLPTQYADLDRRGLSLHTQLSLGRNQDPSKKDLPSQNYRT